MSMEKRIALIVGCAAIYFVMQFITGGKFKIFLVVALIAYGTYWCSKR